MSMYESWIDKQVREAQERGDFDDLPGTGQPLPDRGEQDDDDWWLKSMIRREELTGMAPASLRLRREVEDVDERVAKALSEQVVRELVSDLNARIERANRGMIDGPPVHLRPVNVEDVVARWRERHRPA